MTELSAGKISIIPPIYIKPYRFSAMERMVMARRWLLADPNKVPHYTNGQKRHGSLDSPDDIEKLSTYHEAKERLSLRGAGWHLGFALGPDGGGGFWQGIDLDAVANNQLSDLANDAPGYVEMSPSKAGQHSIGYGRQFPVLGSNKTGIEAYSHARYFTVTENKIRDSELLCLADYVEQSLAPRHSSLPMVSASNMDSGGLQLDPRTVSELRSAISFLRADNRDLWIEIGLALKELGETGRGMWLDWSRTSEKYDPINDPKKWDSFKPKHTGYQVVFKKAQDAGWVNPASKVAQLASEIPYVSDFQLRTPRNFLTTAIAPALDLANVPVPISQFAKGYSDAHGFDQSGVVMAAIASAAAMLNDGFKLEMKPGWLLSPRLWVTLIGKSASGKSPTIKAATEAVKFKHTELIANFYETYQPDPDHSDPRPPEPALYTSDTTIEALSERLRNNPRGMLMVTEEFSSWIGSIDSSNKGEAAKNRGAWLQLYDGGPYQIDRIGRKSYQVQNWGASVLTATTPSALAEHMKYLPEDGLIQRFIPIILGPRDFQADGDSRDVQANWRNWSDFIFRHTPAVIQLSPEARSLFKATEIELGQIATAMDDISPALASHMGKYGEMVARIALIYHAFETDGQLLLSAATLQKAINLMRQVRQHSVCLYSDILSRSPATEIARALAYSLAAADPTLQTIGRDWMTQHCRAFAKAKDDRIRREAVQLLEDLDWLRDVSERNYAGWPTKLEVNLNIFRLYAREGEMHRIRRAAVQSIFGDQPDA